jgi:hypothetical protein
MARPRRGEEKDRPKHLGFRVATWVYDGVQRLAEEQGQPASEIAHELLEMALGNLGIKPPKQGAESSQPVRSAARRSR